MSTYRPCGELREALAVYVLGAIEPADRDAVDRHLPGCADCRDELAGLAGLPALLRRVSVAEATALAVGGTGRPGNLPSGQVLRSMLARSSRQRGRQLRTMAAAAAVAGLVAGAGVIAGWQAAQPAPPAASASVDRHVPGSQPADPGQRNCAVCGIAMGPAAERAGNRNPARHGLRAGGHQPQRTGGGRGELDRHRPPGCLVPGVRRGAAVRNPGVRTLIRIEDPGPASRPGRYRGAARVTGRKIVTTRARRRFCPSVRAGRSVNPPPGAVSKGIGAIRQIERGL